jgi:predicted O-linked N-acetylglucosamine transferase (SPINDLY family)
MPAFDTMIAETTEPEHRCPAPIEPPAPDYGDGSIIDLITIAETLSQSGNQDRGLQTYEAWLRHHPTDPHRHVACFNYGSLLLQTGHFAKAAIAFSETTQLQPDFLPAYINAGLALERLGHADHAVAQWLNVVGHVGPLDANCIANKTSALKHLGRVYQRAGNIALAEEAMRQCLAIDPHQHDACQHWILFRLMQCKWPVIVPTGTLTRSLLMTAIEPLGVAILADDPIYQLAHAWRSFERLIVRPAAPHTVGRWIPPEPPRRQTRPLRIGYVSPDFRGHAVGFLSVELFELHDRGNFEIFAYYSGRPQPDALQARIRRNADHWTEIGGWTDKQAARKIVEDEIDILIDLGGHTDGSPLTALALRPAPVIVNWLGYPGTMGTPYHQYIIADDTIIPPEYEKYYSERVIRLPCYQPTDRKRIVAETPTRAEVGLPHGAFVYCCFNGSQKVNPAMFRCWMSILHRTPNAVLWLLSCDAATDERLRQQAAAQGIAPDRLIFAARKGNAEHLARFPLADLFLDTSPYGAHTTASDAMWMGVPVVTVAGHSFASRVCASLVRAAGLPELVCNNRQAYTDLAVELGSDPDRLHALRERLRLGRDHCTLFNTPLLVARLEALFRQIWNDYLCNRIPEPDLTNLAVYDEIGGWIDHETYASSDLAEYENKYKTELTYRDRVSPVAPDCRLWPASP